MEKHQEKTIITQTKLNIELLGSLVLNLKSNPKKSIINFFKDWQADIGWDKPDEDYAIVNQGVLLTHLYGLLVYPQQVFFDDIPNGIYLNQIDKSEWGNFSIVRLPSGKITLPSGKKCVTHEDELTLEFFLRKIRNAISHASVEITDDMDFIFNDEDGTQIKYSINGIQVFIRKFSKCYMSKNWC